MKKKFAFSIIVLFIINVLLAESNSEKFWNLWNKENEEPATEFLKEWEKKNKKDPEFVSARLNQPFWVNRKSPITDK